MAGPRYERVLAEVCGEPWSGRGLGGMLSYSTVVYTLVLAQNHLKLQQNIRDLLPSRPFYGTKAWEENSAGLIWKTMYTCVIQFQILATHLSVNHYIGIHATISSATTALHARLYLCAYPHTYLCVLRGPGTSRPCRTAHTQPGPSCRSLVPHHKSPCLHTGNEHNMRCTCTRARKT